MNKQTFMRILSKELSGINAEEKADILNYYDEYTDDLLLNEGSLESLDDPVKIARNIKAQSMLDATKKMKDTPKKGLKILGSIILLVLAAPIGLPLIIVLLALILSGVIIFGVLLFIPMIIIFALGVSTIFSISIGVRYLFMSFWQSLAVIGFGIFSVGLILLVYLLGKSFFSTLMRLWSQFAEGLKARLD